jgi:hypothetical protein
MHWFFKTILDQLGCLLFGDVLLLIVNLIYNSPTLESGIDVGQRIIIGPGRLDKNNTRRALNKHRAWKI